MDNENFGLTEAPIPLDQLMPAPEEQAKVIPEASARNKASTLALLSDPSSISETYQTILNEARQGKTLTADQVESAVLNKNGGVDMKALISMLGDRAVDQPTKRRLIETYASNGYLKDVNSILRTRSLEAASQGETVDSEKARISTADAIREMQVEAETQQGLVNAFAASRDNSTDKALSDITAAALIPFGTNIITGRVAAAQEGNESVWNIIKKGALTGSQMSTMRDTFKTMPPAQRTEYIRNLAKSLSENGGIVFPGSNHYAQVEMLRNITEDGRYEDFDKFLDNASTLLDIVGLGGSIKGLARGGKTAVKGVSVGTKAVDAADSFTATVDKIKATGGVRPEDLAKTTGVPKATVYPAGVKEQITTLQTEYKGLLENGGLANRGDVSKLNAEKAALEAKMKSAEDETKALAKTYQKARKLSYKEALKEAKTVVDDRFSDVTAQLSRIDEQIAKNADAAKVQQRMGEIENEVANLERVAAKGAVEAPVAVNYVTAALKQFDTTERISLNSHISLPHPVAPLAVMNQTNPAQARGLIAAVTNGADDVALALSGMNRAEALVSQVIPAVLSASRKVVAKVVDPFRALNDVDPMLKDAVNAAGGTQFTAAERASAKAKFTRDFTQAAGLTVQDGMGGFKLTDDGAKFEISAVYGTNEGAFSNARQAVDQAKLSLRMYGVSENEIELLVKQGNDYKATTLAEAGETEGSYLVRVKTHQDFDFNDIGKFEPVDVKRNLLDRFKALVPNTGGASAARYLMDPASMLHPVYTNSIGAAIDRANYIDKLFLELTSEYSDIVSKLPKDRRVKAEDHLKLANEQGIPFNRADLVGRGFVDKEIKAIEAWKNVWDNHYYFENDDLVKTLNRDGYQMFVGPNNTQLFAKEVAKGADIGKIAIGPNKTVGRVFDPTSNTAVFQSKAEVDMLYSAGGTYAKLRRPMEINGELISHIIVQNDASSYLRKFRDTDAVLNYRPMHYTRSYKAAKFVDEIGADGFRRAIAVGPDTPSANSFAERMQANNPDKKYVVRDDDRGMLRGTDDWFDIESASGRLAQRHRGQILGTTDGAKILGEGNFVLDPTNSAIKAAQSLAGRVAMRPVIETAKERAVQQYGHLFPKDAYGKPYFPSTIDEIGAKGEFTTKELADARTVVGHLHYIENGYGNAVDDTFKQVMNAVANELGEKGFGNLERGVRAVGELAPTQKAKAAVFQSYIVMSNIFRQWIIQSNGAVRTAAYNPMHVMTGGTVSDIARYLRDLGNPNKSDFSKFVNESGMISGLDKSNLVRGSLSQMAEQRNLLLNYGHKGLVEIPRRLGFDAGESMHLIAWMSAVYNKAERAGLDVTNKTVREELYGKVRALTGEMNRAGDMPYNAGAMSTITQFLQVPHKSYLMYTNRKLDGATKLRMLAGDTLLWGSAGGVIGATFGGDILPDDPEARYAVTEGVQAYVYNKLFKEIAGETQDLDLSALNPYGLDGWGKLFMALKGDGKLSDVAAMAPAYNLFNTENGRIPLAIKEMARYFSGEIDPNIPPATMTSVADRVAKIASGYSSYAVAHAALESGTWKSNAGDRLPGEVTYPLAIAKSLGFDRLSTRELYKLSQERFTDEKKFKDAVLKDYKETNRLLTEAMNMPKDERDIVVAATNVMLSKWKGNEAAWKIIIQQQKKDLTGKDSQLLIQMIRNSGISDVGATRDQINRAPIDEEYKKILLDRFNNDVLED